MTLPPFVTKRLTKELSAWKDSPGISIHEVTSLDTWQVDIVASEGSPFAGEKYTLQFKFTDAYPMTSPIVIFLPPTPMHEHVYSNGHICLNILDDSHWTPALSVSAVCISLQSMLSSAEKKQVPMGHDQYVKRVKDRNPKLTSWYFHDDKV